MKKIIENDLPNALREVKALLNNNGVLEKEYDGYASSFGPAVINSGLLPALSFFSDSKKINRKKFVNAIYGVIGRETGTADLLAYVLSKVYGANYHTARAGNLGTPNKQELLKVKKRIMAASVAIKLAMRNYEQSDSQTQNS